MKQKSPKFSPPAPLRPFGKKKEKKKVNAWAWDRRQCNTFKNIELNGFVAPRILEAASRKNSESTALINVRTYKRRKIKKGQIP